MKSKRSTSPARSASKRRVPAVALDPRDESPEWTAADFRRAVVVPGTPAKPLVLGVNYKPSRR